jgi:hypothetical protein
MSYHEYDVSRHQISVSYGVSLWHWTLPLSVGIGGEGQRERGFSVSFLCFWFGMNWWPKDYPVPPSARVGGDGEKDWLQRFNRVDDAGYQIEAADTRAESIVEMAQSLRNAIDVLRGLHYAAEKKER